MELDPRGGHIRPGKACSEGALTLCPGRCYFLRRTVCPVRCADQSVNISTVASRQDCSSMLRHACTHGSAGSWDGTLRLWDLNSGNTTRRFIGHNKDVLSVAFSVDNRQVCISGRPVCFVKPTQNITRSEVVIGCI